MSNSEDFMRLAAPLLKFELNMRSKFSLCVWLEADLPPGVALFAGAMRRELGLILCPCYDLICLLKTQFCPFYVYAAFDGVTTELPLSMMAENVCASPRWMEA